MTSESINALHRDAERAMRQGNYREAHACCTRILKHDPQHADAVFLLGMIALAHGQARKALDLIDAALSLAPDNSEYLAQRARCLTLLKADSAVLETAKRALALNPGSALTLDTLGVALSKAGDHRTAIAAFSRAVDRDPDNAQFHFNLAASQNFLGDFEAAARSYERAIAIKPDFYRARWALSEQSKATRDDNHIGALSDLLATPGLDADAMLYLCHALAKEHEDIGDYATAFDYWQRGKSAKAGQSRLSIEHYRAIFDAIESVCTGSFVNAVPTGFESDEPIFVVGMPRTGTTLVERILASHGDVFAAGELNDFGLCMKRAAGTPSNRILDPETVFRSADLDFAALGAQYIDSTRPRTGHTKHFIDKLPPNFLYAGFIHRALPQARIVCLRRNPLDTCLSNYRQLFSINAPYYDYAYDLVDTGRYYLMFDRLVRHWETVLGDSFLVVQYEDVVQDIEQQARKLLSFCGLAWDPVVLNFHEHEAPVATASYAQVRKPIYSSSVRRWQRYQSQLQPLIEHLRQHGVACD